MVSWSQIPPEIKRHVAENLDFMSRVSMKATSHSDRLIVDSTKFHIPRVRFGYKEGKCLIVIYTKIDTFLRLEMEKCGNGVVVYKSENSFQPSHRKFLPSTDTLTLGLSILKQFAHESIKIRALEWDNVGDYPDQSPDSFFAKFPEIFGKNDKFHCKEMLYSILLNEDAHKFFNEVCVWDELNSFRQVHFVPSEQGLYPIMMQECVLSVNGKIKYHTSMNMISNYYIHFIDRFTSRNFLITSERFGNVLYCAVRDVSGNGYDPGHGSRHADPEFVLRYYSTQCGTWNYQMFGKHEERLKGQMEAEKCGLSFLCPHHTDPFDYWYYKNLPRRILTEPFWCDFMHEGDNSEDVVRRMARHLKRDEDGKPKPEMKTMTSSWGFRIPTKKEKKEDVLEVEDPGVEIQEKVAEIQEASGASEFFKLFFTMTLLPILISFVFYALFF